MALTGDAPPAADKPKQFDLGSLTGLVAVLAGLAYGTGVVASNTYLHGLGITDFSFAKPKLLLTGTLVLSTFLLLACGPIFFAWSRCAAKEGKDATGSRELLFVGLGALVVLVIAASLLCFQTKTQLGEMRVWWIWEHVTKGVGLQKGWAIPAIVLGLFTPVCLAPFFAFKAKKYWAQMLPKKGGACIPLECFHFAGAIALALMSIVTYIMIFTFVFYPSIPVEFGGGKPYFVSFAIADAQVCQLQRIGIPFDTARPDVTKPLPVLHETDTLVAVWVQGKRGPQEAAKDAAVAAATTADTAPQDPRKDSSGVGESQFIVVQLDMTAITASRAYPHWRTVPELNREYAGCQAGASAVSGAATPQTSPLKSAASSTAP